MTLKEFESLKYGDLVTQKRGKNKGRLAMVTHVWRSDVRISGYYDTRIAGVYLDLSEPNPDRIWSPWFFDFCDFECTHMALKRLSKEDLK